MGGKEKAGKEKTQRKIEKKEKTAKTEKVGKKEKEKTPMQSIGDNIQKMSEVKVQSDIKNAEKLLQRAKEKPLLTAIGEGIQKGAEAKVESDTENAEQLLQRTKERPLLKAIEAGIQKGAEAKVNFDLAKSEKLIQKGFGAVPGINIAAETAKEYMDMLGELLLTMDEGLKTGAKTGEGPKKSGEKAWFVDAVQSYERDLFTQGENIIGFGKGLVDIGKGTLAFAGDFVEYLQGQNPEFLKEVWEGIAAAGMGVLNGLSHPEETLQALDEAMSKATPEDMGRLGAYAFVAALPVGAPAGSSRLLSLLKKISPDMGNMGLTIKIVDEAGNASRAADKILDGVEAPKGNMKPFEGGSGALESASKWTSPSRKKDLLAKPEGKPTKINYDDPDLDNIRSLIRENEAADILAKNGYQVEQNPTVPGRKNPDYSIEGKIFDCYSPKQGTSVRNIASNIAKKVENGQTDRIILNLDDWHGGGGNIDELIKQLNEWPIIGLKEVKVINHYHEVMNIYP